MRLRAILFLAFLPGLALAQTQSSPQPASSQIISDIKSGDFTDASQLATATGDPLMMKLVTFFQLLDPGGGTADEIQSFIAANPDWPEQGLLALRAAAAAGLSAPSTPEITPPFLSQSEALHAAGQDTDAAALWAAHDRAQASLKESSARAERVAATLARQRAQLHLVAMISATLWTTRFRSEPS